MSKIKLLYIFSKSRDFKHAKKYPPSIFYGYYQFSRNSDFKVTLLEPQKKNLLWLLWRPFELYFYSKTGIGFKLYQILASLKLINSQDIVIAVNDSIGIPLAILKKLRLVKPKIVFISAGLINNLEINKKHWVFKFYRWLLKGVDLILCWSPFEEKLYKSLIKAKAKFIPLEPDIDFFKPDYKMPLENFILSIGKDIGRDFKTLFEAVEKLKIPTKVITNRINIKNLEIPDNVELHLEHINYSTLIKWYKKARVVVINIKEIHRFSGQRALLEALSMGKTIIAAKTKSLTTTYNPKNGKEIVFYQPSNSQNLRNKINSIYNNPEKIKKIGLQARKFAEKMPKNLFYKNLKNFILKL